MFLSTEVVHNERCGPDTWMPRLPGGRARPPLLPFACRSQRQGSSLPGAPGGLVPADPKVHRLFKGDTDKSYYSGGGRDCGPTMPCPDGGATRYTMSPRLHAANAFSSRRRCLLQLEGPRPRHCKDPVTRPYYPMAGVYEQLSFPSTKLTEKSRAK